MNKELTAKYDALQEKLSQADSDYSTIAHEIENAKLELTKLESRLLSKRATIMYIKKQLQEIDDRLQADGQARYDSE